jgi:DNA-binding transcriptional regulator YiaG
VICTSPDTSTQLITLWTRLEQPEIGDAIAHLREYFNLSRSDLVRRVSDVAAGGGVGVDTSLIYRWEKGRPRPRPSGPYRRLLALVCERELCKITTDLRAAFLRRLLEVTNTGLVARPDMVGDDEPISLDLIRDLTALTRDYLRMRDAMSPAALRLAVAHHVDELTKLVLHSDPSPTAKRVRSLAAQAAILAGWLSFQAEDRVDAMRRWSIAGEFARDAGDHGLRALALGSRSRIYSSGHHTAKDADVNAAIGLIDDAIRLAQTAGSSTLLSWLNVRRATLLGEQSSDESDAMWDDVLDDLIITDM